MDSTYDLTSVRGRLPDFMKPKAKPIEVNVRVPTGLSGQDLVLIAEQLRPVLTSLSNRIAALEEQNANLRIICARQEAALNTLGIGTRSDVGNQANSTTNPPSLPAADSIREAFIDAIKGQD